jgi:hypothetical protein
LRPRSVDSRLHFAGDFVKALAVGTDLKLVLVDAHCGHVIHRDRSSKTTITGVGSSLLGRAQLK